MIQFGNYLETESKIPVSKLLLLLLLLLFTHPLKECFWTFYFFQNESAKDFKFLRF